MTRGVFSGRASEPPVRISDVEYRRRGGVLGACTVTGRIESNADRPLRVGLTFAGFVDGDLVTGGTAEDVTSSAGGSARVFPGEDSTFEFELISPAECPPSLDRIEVYPDAR